MVGEKGSVRLFSEDNQGAPMLYMEIVKPPPATDEPLHLRENTASLCQIFESRWIQTIFTQQLV